MPVGVCVKLIEQRGAPLGRSREAGRSRHCIALSLVAVAVIVSACTTASRPAGSPASSAPPASAQGFWESFRISGDEVEGYRLIAEMGEAADAVVVGRFASLAPGRAVHGDAPEDVVVYASLRLEITRVLAGQVEDRSVPLELLVSAAQPTVRELERLESSLPRGDLVVFLRAKRGAGEAGLYRPVNSLGLWASSDRGALDTPLAEEPPAGSVFEDEVAGSKSVAEMAEYVSAQVRAERSE